MGSINDEQLCELEALKSIYPNELRVENENTPVRLLIQLGSNDNKDNEYDEDDESSTTCLLTVELPAEYPEVVPSIELSTSNPDMDDDDLENVVGMLKQLAVENVGLPMVFTLATAAQEELNHLVERTKQKRVEEEARKKAEEEEKEKHRFDGTRVTVESFLAWKARFDEEMGRNKVALVDPASRRLTGREQFLKDASLSTSDIRLIEESGEEMKIDESLYDDVDDLGDDEVLSDSDDAEHSQRT